MSSVVGARRFSSTNSWICWWRVSAIEGLDSHVDPRRLGRDLGYEEARNLLVVREHDAVERVGHALCRIVGVDRPKVRDLAGEHPGAHLLAHALWRRQSQTKRQTDRAGEWRGPCHQARPALGGRGLLLPGLLVGIYSGEALGHRRPSPRTSPLMEKTTTVIPRRLARRRWERGLRRPQSPRPPGRPPDEHGPCERASPRSSSRHRWWWCRQRRRPRPRSRAPRRGCRPGRAWRL